jgi:hypothetical protein
VRPPFKEYYDGKSGTELALWEMHSPCERISLVSIPFVLLSSLLSSPFCDGDRVRYGIVVKLSFAHAEGRNYRQLPARARLREEPSPADIVYLKR